jgi:hypothetical protein
MKNFILYTASMIVMVCGFVACDDDFLNRVPQSSITPPTFFKSVDDLELYVNGLYNGLMPGGFYEDFGSDNVTIRQGSEPYSGLLYGLRSPDIVESWEWGSVRAVNLMLNSLDDVSGDAADIDHYVGIARYFRARLYSSLVKNYSDVPWYDKVIDSNEEELLYKTQDPRATVVDHIMEDFEFAVTHIKTDMGNRTRIHRYVALAELSQFALYEGTYRKYHSELGLASTADRFLQRAVSASEEIMNSGQFEITGGGTNVALGSDALRINGSDGFRALFSSLKLGDNREMILWAEYMRTPYWRSHRADDLMAMSTNNYSLSRSLQESFLTRDGKPFSTVEGYATKEYAAVFADRDPRMAETFAWPGLYEESPVSEARTYHVTTPGRGGYDQSKFFAKSQDSDTKSTDNTGQFTSLPVFRYGEILLNYAEAKAELGQLDDVAVARSINLLRNRVGMPPFNPAVEVDDALKALYPGVSDVQILAVRRERRVELACEGLRQQDIYRWGAGKLYEAAVSQQGIYIPELPYVYDVTGDGVPDRGIAASAAQHTADEVTWDDLNDPDVLFYLENGDSGYIRNNRDIDRHFEEPKYYYMPIATSQIVLNPNLKQPYGW